LYRQYKTKEELELGSETSQLEQVMLDECNALNVESVRKNNGTITRTIKEQFACNNWDEFKQLYFRARCFRVTATTYS
jgi:hypothetical protein